MATKKAKAKKKTTTQLKKNQANYENSLFKFRGFTKNEHGVCFGVDSILNAYVYAASLGELNDVFEGAVLYSLLNEIEASKKYEPTQNLDIKALDLPVQFKELVESKGIVINTLGDVLEFNRMYAVFSASEKKYEHLLWSHYANDCKGFCIEYNKNELKNSLLMNNNDCIGQGDFVNYITKLDDTLVNCQGVKTAKCYIPIAKGNPIDSINAIFYNKPKCWEYEKEFRFSFLSNGQKKHSHSSIKAIYFGPKACPKNIDELVSQVRAIKEYDHVIFKRMKPKSRSFSLEEETLNY